MLSQILDGWFITVSLVLLYVHGQAGHLDPEIRCESSTPGMPRTRLSPGWSVEKAGEIRFHQFHVLKWNSIWFNHVPYLNDGYPQKGGYPQSSSVFFMGFSVIFIKTFLGDNPHFWKSQFFNANVEDIPSSRHGFPGEVEVPRSRNWCEGDLAAWANGIVMEFHMEILGFDGLWWAFWGDRFFGAPAWFLAEDRSVHLQSFPMSNHISQHTASPSKRPQVLGIHGCNLRSTFAHDMILCLFLAGQFAFLCQKARHWHQLTGSSWGW